jgi:ribosomal protein S18 acetylase RimI-like enzyme
MRITLRPVGESDETLLFRLYASTREYELSQVPWTGDQKHAFLTMQYAAQTHSYASSYPEATHDMICVEERPVGRIYLARLPDRWHILDITIDPASRNRGIGSAVLRQILEEADRTENPVRIYVESFNPSIKLFERLDFRVVSVEGFQVLLERPPVTSP